MYTGKQHQNEVGNKVSRQVEIGTRQRVKFGDERRNSVLQLYILKHTRNQPCKFYFGGNNGCFVDNSDPPKKIDDTVYVGDGGGHSEEQMIDVMYGNQGENKIAGTKPLSTKQNIATGNVAVAGEKNLNIYTYYPPCDDNSNYNHSIFNCRSLLSRVLTGNSIVWMKAKPQQRVQGDWTEEEDKRLLELISLRGTYWSRVSPHFPNRTLTCLKTRYQWLNSQKAVPTPANKQPKTFLDDDFDLSPELMALIDTVPTEWLNSQKAVPTPANKQPKTFLDDDFDLSSELMALIDTVPEDLQSEKE